MIVLGLSVHHRRKLNNVKLKVWYSYQKSLKLFVVETLLIRIFRGRNWLNWSRCVWFSFLKAIYFNSAKELFLSVLCGDIWSCLSPVHPCHCSSQIIINWACHHKRDFLIMLALSEEKPSKTFNVQSILPWCTWTPVRERRKCLISFVNKKNRIEDKSKLNFKYSSFWIVCVC